MSNSLMSTFGLYYGVYIFYALNFWLASIWFFIGLWSKEFGVYSMNFTLCHDKKLTPKGPKGFFRERLSKTVFFWYVIQK